jgi:hypothetical protein
METITKELAAKAYIYNAMIKLKIENKQLKLEEEPEQKN